VVVRPDQVSVGVLVTAVPRDAVDAAVAACGVGDRRRGGKLPAHVVAYVRHEALRCIPNSVGRNSEGWAVSSGECISRFDL
jgi:hypothetical protein